MPTATDPDACAVVASALAESAKAVRRASRLKSPADRLTALADASGNLLAPQRLLADLVALAAVDVAGTRRGAGRDFATARDISPQLFAKWLTRGRRLLNESR